METRAFAPLYKTSTPSNTGGLYPSTTIAASTSAATNTVPFAGAGGGYYQLEICNQTNGWAFVNVGIIGTIAAATVATGYPIAPGCDKVISIQPEVNAASVILASGSTSGNVTFSIGEGV